RAGAAGNRATPGPLLVSLAADGDYRVRARLAANPRCPAEALARLMEDAYQTIRYRVLVHPACDERLVAAKALALARSLRQHEREVLRDMAYHPGFPAFLRPLLFLTERRLAR
ncbi:MAG: hypothetical protein ACUVRF_08320, partial [Desulfotomaculales bacterium]